MLKQLVSGLEAAHEKGVIHRDLKPPNIKISEDGNLKILDFGLAKAFSADETPGNEMSQSPTLTRGTATGAIMGTAAYMSPEQSPGEVCRQEKRYMGVWCGALRNADETPLPMDERCSTRK